MGIALSDIPAIGSLAPVARRQLARWLRSVVPKGAVVPQHQLQTALDGSAFAPVSCATLLALGWLEHAPGGLSADTYARRIAAGAVDGNRMSLDEAVSLARIVRDRVQCVGGVLGGVQVLRVVLYGSAVRSVGNLKSDIGDLDLALEIDVIGPGWAQRLQHLPAEQRWRAAIEESGWSEHLMQGDDRITLAGSLARVLTLFNRQLHGFDVPADGRQPALVTLVGASDDQLPAPAVAPALFGSQADESRPCPVALLDTLAYIEAATLATQERAQAMTCIRL